MRRHEVPTDAEIEAAYRVHDTAVASEPLAGSVRYDRSEDTVTIEMTNGAALIVPRGLLQGLHQAGVDALEDVVIAASGTAIRWPALDADFSVASLLHGVFGGKRWMSELARKAGSTKSEAKSAAAKLNGAKGGRPRKAR